MVAPLPTGTVTLLFSDIEGSTSLLRQLGERYADVLSAQRRLLRDAWARSGGVELGTEGDSFFVVFASAGAAVAAALDAQRALAGHGWPEGSRIRVRMGLHTGEPTRHEDGYVGIDVHVAARVAAAAHGGQVVVTDATRGVAEAAAGVSYADLGRHRLKDIPDPQHLYQLVADGLDAEFPPLRTLGERTHLPAPATSLVGRDGELRELHALLTGGGARLVTLTGPGGSGKTRLAVAVADALGEQCPDGVYFVALESARSADVAWTTLAETLGLPGEARDPSSIVDFLAGRQLLLVLDNLEQLPDAGGVVQRVMDGAPDVRLVATSRRPLHVYGEHEHPVPPLELPREASPSAGSAGAVALFVERARMVRPGFALSADNAEDVAEICRLVDGLPLAIELVAARLKLLSPRALRTRLAADLDLAVSQTPRPERHRTLRGAVTWSYGLLPTELQRFFRSLGAFAGDFDLDAVSAVLGGELDPLQAVDDLLDVSLVTVVERPSGEVRVRLLRTIAVYARELLVAAGELEAVRRRHAEHYLEVVREVAPQLRTGAYLTAKDRIEQEMDNIRAVLEWTVPESGAEGEPVPAELHIGLSIAQELYWCWYACGYAVEGRRWLSRVVAAAGQESPEVMTSLHGLGVLLIQQGEPERGRDALRRSLDFWRRQGDASKIARELSSLAIAHRALGEPGVAREHLTEALELSRASGDRERQAAVLSNLAIIDVDEGLPASALERLQEALVLDRERGDTWAVVADHVNIAGALLEDDRPREAFETLRTIAPTGEGLGDPDMSVSLIELIAIALAGLGAPHRAARLVGAATAMREALELPIDAPDAAVLEKGIASARASIGDGVWQAAVDSGRGLSVAEALREGLADPPDQSAR